MWRGAVSGFLAMGLVALACVPPASAGVTQYGDLGLVYEQTTTNFPGPPTRTNQSSYHPCDVGDAAGLPLLGGGGWIFDTDPMVTPFETGQAYFAGLKFRSQVAPSGPESWHEIADNVSTNDSLGLGELTICGAVDDVSYVKDKGFVPKKEAGSAKARCPSGKHAVGGGGVMKGRLGKPRLIGSFPIDDDDGNDAPDDGWRTIGYNGSKKDRKLLVYAICAPVDDLDYLNAGFSAAVPRLFGELFCGAGQHVVGGGFRLRGGVADSRLVESRTEPPGDSWTVLADSFSPGGAKVDVHAICHS